MPILQELINSTDGSLGPDVLWMSKKVDKFIVHKYIFAVRKILMPSPKKEDLQLSQGKACQQRCSMVVFITA
ncbi:hypothetical protein GIB67_004656 [Kingdonia uniflora]|uniref:Uncharacterized protein n=1 Tax=Kingdonia uniflora TaxID=39325 RepID=A0A7J7P5B0_9MAGN|nr:hypothetical protein GIB67_004656 [Kingdonia uniflora]